MRKHAHISNNGVHQWLLAQTYGGGGGKDDTVILLSLILVCSLVFFLSLHRRRAGSDIFLIQQENQLHNWMLEGGRRGLDCHGSDESIFSWVSLYDSGHGPTLNEGAIFFNDNDNYLRPLSWEMVFSTSEGIATVGDTQLTIVSKNG